MASTKILEQKKLVVDEIVNKLKTSESVIICLLYTSPSPRD